MKKAIALSTLLALGALGIGCGPAANNANVANNKPANTPAPVNTATPAPVNTAPTNGNTNATANKPANANATANANANKKP